MKQALWLTLLLLLLAGGGSWLTWQSYQEFLRTPLQIPSSGKVLQIPPGASGTDIVAMLAEQGMSSPGWQWKLLMRLEPHIYMAGEYQLERGLLPREVLGQLASGQVVQYRITLVEGWTFRQFAELIAADTVLVHTLDLNEPEAQSELLSELDIDHPEGWFLPETYQFTRGDTDRNILQRAHLAMRRQLQLAWQARELQLPLKTPYELLIMASIIEKETALDEEREQVAGVFRRRLDRGMRLQTDPTVIYGLGESFDGDIRRRDLQTDTPYNTYTRHGLPPTPIAMPGKASLAAAANPAQGDALYFVADGSGGHTFSATLEQHQAAVKKLLERN